MPEIKVYVDNETFIAFLNKTEINKEYRKEIVKMIQDDLGIRKDEEEK
jgi:hypothetical protein